MMPLWHNYVTFAACIAPSSTGVSVVERNPPPYDDSAASTLPTTCLVRRRPNILVGHISTPSTG